MVRQVDYRWLVESGRRGWWAAAAAVSALLLVGTSAWALDPHRQVSQYGHDAWRTQDGLISRSIAITQTSDGYIWIASLDGLVRFDGITFSIWQPPQGESLPSSGFGALLGARDGTLWIGTTGGLSRLRNGHLFNYTTTERSPGIAAIVEDHAGTIWVTRYRLNDGMGPLCRVSGDRLTCYGERSGLTQKYALGAAEDSAGALWFACQHSVCRFADGVFTSYFNEASNDKDAPDAVDVTASGAIVWASFDGVGPSLGVREYSGGAWRSLVVPELDGSSVRSHALFVDRERTLWIGTESSGIYHVHDGHADRYSKADGLSGNGVTSFYEDREGNLWVTTDRGVDMFRDTAVTTFSTPEGLVGSNVNSVLALRSGAVWVGNEQALNIIEAGRIRTIDAAHGLPGQNVEGLFEDSAGRIWVGIDDNVMVYDHGRFEKISAMDGKPLVGAGIGSGFAEDHQSGIWAVTMATNAYSLLRIQTKRVIEAHDVTGVIKAARFVAVDEDDAVWIGGRQGELARFRDGQFETTIRVDRSSESVTGYSLTTDPAGNVWYSTNRGLYRWHDEHGIRLDTRNGLPCSAIYSATSDDAGSVWLYTKCGLLRIERSDWAMWLQNPERHVGVTTFDLREGAQPDPGAIDQPAATKTPDGRLWFASQSFVQTIDPSRTFTNRVPPPVLIETVSADGRSYPNATPLRLARSRNIEIDYTALSFKSPRDVTFRYRLEGHDDGWQRAGTRRQALYNDLHPGTYRFRVTAANDAGVWNDLGASLEFIIPPAWFETTWFRTLSIAGILMAVVVLYRLRVRHIANAITVRFEERLAERTRVARELHDTLLQTMQGSKLVADHALKQPHDHQQLVRAVEQLSEWLARANDEARAAVNSLRASTSSRNDLAGALQRALDECRTYTAMNVSLTVNGSARDLHPIVRDEIYRIADEAIRNARQHSGGSRLDVTLEYTRDVRLRVRDDGIGIPPEILENGKDGHFGIRGMRERAERIGARYSLQSTSASGTDLTLIVPGRVAFISESGS